MYGTPHLVSVLRYQSLLFSTASGSSMSAAPIRFLLLLAAAAAAMPAAALDWELQRDEAGIRVWTKPVPGSAVARFRGETFVKADTAAIKAVLGDVPRMTEWFPDCVEARTLSKEGDVELRYMVTGAPWPVDDRDAIYRIETIREPSGPVRIEMGVQPEALPEQEGRVRVRRAQGGWKLTPEEGGTRVAWELHLEPGGSVPTWLINQRVVETPFRALRELRARAEGQG